MGFFGSRGVGRKKNKRWGRKANRKSRARRWQSLAFELLESRQLLTVALDPIVGPDDGGAFDVPASKALYVPLTASDPGETITYSASSSDPDVQVSILEGNPTLQLEVTGMRDDDGVETEFSGVLTIQLFENLAPDTVQVISDLVTSGFYDELEFYRIVPDFVIQGGANGTKPADQFADEFDIALTFNSPGLLAMANPDNPDMNTSEIFITDIDLALADQPQFLNFRHSIFGQLTSGFDTYEDIMNAIGVTPTNSTPSEPVTIVSASIITDTQNGVLQIIAPNDFTGTSEITVTADSSDGSTDEQSFSVNVAPPAEASDNQPIVLAPVVDQTTTVNTPISFEISAEALAGVSLEFSVTGADGFRSTLQDVTAEVDEGSDGMATVTLTPTEGFVGTIELLVHADDDGNNLHDAQQFTLTVEPLSVENGTLSGFVYIDSNGNNRKDSAELPLEGVLLTLTGVDPAGNLLPSQTTTTGSDGSYQFTNLEAGTYTIKQAQPKKLRSTQSSAGSLGGTAGINRISDIVVSADGEGTNYNFGEAGLTSSVISINLFLASTPPAEEFFNDAVSSGTWAPVVVSMTKRDADPTEADTVRYTVTFNTDVTGVDTSDFRIIAGGDVTDASVQSVTGSGKTYTVTLNTGSGNGTLGLRLLDNDTIVDSSDAPLGGDGPNNGNFVAASYTIGKEPVPPVAPEIVITFATSPINAENVTNTTVSGTGTAGASVSVLVTDGANQTSSFTTTISTAGDWSISGIDVSALDDGTLTYTATATNADGSAQATRFSTKDTVDPAVAIIEVTDPITEANEQSTSISGTGEVGTTITVVAGDGTTTTAQHTTTVQPGGTWTIDGIDVSALADGEITYTATAEDTAGNTSQTSMTATKDTTAPAVTVDEATDPINAGNVDDVTVSGTGEAGATITLVATSGDTTSDVYTTTVEENDTWLIEDIDLNEMDDGTVTFTATATDGAGNPAQSSKTATKDTEAPAVETIELVDENPTSSTTVQYTVNFEEDVTGVDVDDFVPAVTGELVGATIAEVSGSGSSYTVTVTYTEGTGMLGLNLVDDDSILDLAGNPLGGLGIDNGNFTGPEYTIELDADVEEAIDLMLFASEEPDDELVDEVLSSELSWV